MNKQQQLLAIIFSLLYLFSLVNCQTGASGPGTGLAPGPRQGDDNGELSEIGCQSKGCQMCDANQIDCIDCDHHFYLNDYGFCEDREEMEDRGDSMSATVGVIYILFTIIVTHAWLFKSRMNANRFINADKLEEEQQQQFVNPQDINQFQNIQLLRIGVQSDSPSPYERSIKNSQTNSPQIEKIPVKLQGQLNNENVPITLNQPVEGYTNGQQAYPVLQQGYPVTIQGGYPVAQQGYPVSQQGYPVAQQGYPVAQQGYPVQNLQQGYPVVQRQPIQQGPQMVSQDLNGYWLTQAGKFSFKNFSNLHRIRHVMLNSFILNSCMAFMIGESERRGDDNDNDKRKNLLFLAFIVVMIVYWLFTLIPPIVMKILSLCCCLRENPNGTGASVFINFLFYFFSILLIVSTSLRIFKMDGFESQVWILLVLAGFLLIVFFDKKSVEIAKSRKRGWLEKVVRFRKMDFFESSLQKQQQQQQQENM